MMADHVHFDIQTIIIKKLPAKSLIRFRCVSKQWKSLIDSSEFIKNYQSMNAPHLLVRYNVLQYDDDIDGYISILDEYVSIIDNDTFPQHMSPITVPLSLQTLERARISRPPPFGNESCSIVSFNLSNDEFGKVCLPRSLQLSECFEVSKWNECLTVIDHADADIYDHSLNIWVMKDDGVAQSFTIMFHIEPMFPKYYLVLHNTSETSAQCGT
nr:hypothetical protein [Tanacetum cinerariifolium]